MGDWKARSIAKRDFKHDPTEPRLAKGGTKSTRIWCRGVVGRHHEYDFLDLSCFNWDEKKIWAWLNYECSLCGKRELVHLDEASLPN
jgi:hypothetical protein